MEGYKFDYSGYNYPTPVEDTNQPLINEVGEKCDTQGYTMGPEYVKLLNECKKQYEEKTRGIDSKDWVDNGNKNKTVLLAQEKIEGKNFNYLDYIHENGLPESIKILGSLLLIQQFDINITDENREEIMYNLERFISVILWVESPEKFLNEKGGKVSKQEVNTLNASAQTIMFLVDIMTRKNSRLNAFFKRRIQESNGKSIRGNG